MRNENLPAGQALSMTLHVALLLVVLGQVVFLASRHRGRLDLTADQLFTLTDSTRRVLDGLEQKLLIEAYFSPDDTVPPDYRECRPNIRNFLDELVQVGNGKVIVQELNPLADKELADKARRLGITQAQTQQSGAGSVSIQQLWQGLRLRYGGAKQKVIPFVAPQYSEPTQLELQITPAIKELTLEKKAQVGFMEWQFEPALAIGTIEERPQGFLQVRTMPEVQGRYQFTNLRYADVLVPDDIDTLILFRPKGLTDREKYIVDQFLMQGKTLVVFADATDYSIGQSRRFTARAFAFDAPDSEIRFLDQLAHYGIRVQEALVADMQQSVQARLGVPRVFGNLIGGLQGFHWLPIYPYFFRPVDLDWAEVAVNQLGKDNPQLAERYREVFKPGIIKSNPLTQTLARPGQRPTGAPEFFWACPVGLADPLPAGIEGEELLYTSPWTLIDDPPPDNTQPMNFLGSSDQQQQTYQQFYNRLRQRVMSETHRQVPLMATVSGEFTSVFEGRAVPKALGDANTVRVVRDPLDEPIKDDPLADPEPDRTGPGGSDAEKPGAEKPAGEKPTGETPAGQRGEGDRPPNEDTHAVEASEQDPGELPGPPPPEPGQTEAEDAEDAPVYRAVESGRVVVVGDADFLRDDLVGRPQQPMFDYQQIGGPVSHFGRLFFVSLLDWLHQEDDLNAINTRNITSRVLVFAEQDMERERIEDFRERLAAKTSRLQWLNILLPPCLMVGFGLVLASIRHASKKSFLIATES